MDPNETLDNKKLEEVYTTTLWFKNDNDKPIQLYVEPWGSNCEIPPKGYIRIVARGPKYGCPMISQHETDYIYYAWAGSVFALYHNGELISRWNLDNCPPEPSPISKGSAALDTLHILEGLNKD